MAGADRWETLASRRVIHNGLPLAERDTVLPPSVHTRLAVELGVSQGGDRYIGARGDMLSMESFGASAPAEKLFQEFGFTVDNVCARARAMLTSRYRWIAGTKGQIRWKKLAGK